MIEGFLLGATLLTVGLYGMACLAMGWCAGYSHRGLVAAGRRFGRLVAWHRRHRGRSLPGAVAAAYRELFRDVLYLCETGQLRPGR